MLKRDSKITKPFTIFSVFFCFLYIVFSFIYSGSFEKKLGWDEVDYMNASKAGIIANAFETRSPSFIQFTKLSMAKYSKDSNEITKINSTLPKEAEDLFRLRHFHPPLPTYYWSLFIDPEKDINDFSLHVSKIVFAFLSILVFVFSIFILSKKQYLNILQLIVLLSFVTSNLFLSSLKFLNFHPFHSLACIIFLSALILFLKKESKNYSYFLGLSAALLLGTLETGLFVLFGGLVSILIFSSKTVFDFKKMLSAFSSFVVFFILSWPGILYSGGPIKTWMMHAYRVFSMSNVEYQEVSMMGTWIQLYLSNLLLCNVLLAGLILLIFKRKKLDNIFYIPIVISITYGVLITPFSYITNYLLPSVAMLTFGLILFLQKENISND